MVEFKPDMKIRRKVESPKSKDNLTFLQENEFAEINTNMPKKIDKVIFRLISENMTLINHLLKFIYFSLIFYSLVC